MDFLSVEHNIISISGERLRIAARFLFSINRK